MLIVLIGYRATGKTTVAKILAERLGCESVDADVELERRAGTTIADIFANQGEPAFRDLETDVIADLCQRDDLVLAAGGGAPMRDINRAAMRRGRVVWLTAKPETIYERMYGDETTASRRPNLTEKGGLEEIVDVLERRTPIYRESAHHEVETENRTPKQVAEAVLQCLGA